MIWFLLPSVTQYKLEFDTAALFCSHHILANTPNKRNRWQQQCPVRWPFSDWSVACQVTLGALRDCVHLEHDRQTPIIASRRHRCLPNCYCECWLQVSHSVPIAQGHCHYTFRPTASKSDYCAAWAHRGLLLEKLMKQPVLPPLADTETGLLVSRELWCWVQALFSYSLCLHSVGKNAGSCRGEVFFLWL